MKIFKDVDVWTNSVLKLIKIILRGDVMKKIVIFFLICLLLINTISLTTACSKKSEIEIEYKDNKLYSVFSDKNLGQEISNYNSKLPISFENYESTATTCVARANIYVRFIITFNNTPKGYKAIDVYELKNLNLETTYEPERKLTCRAGKKDNEIEVIIYLQSMSNSEIHHKIKSLTYKEFDSVTGQKIEKTFELNYKFNIKNDLNYINRFDDKTKFNADVISATKTSVSFNIDTAMDYDSIVYYVNRVGTGFYSGGSTVAVILEDEMAKANSYYYYNSKGYSGWVYSLSIVGYKKNGIVYYFSPISLYFKSD